MLKLCVESIEKNSAAEHEILIHVNDGSDGTLDWVREKGFKHTHSPENIGVCKAMNSLRPLATCDWIVYINDDMYMAPGWDTAFYKEIEEAKTREGNRLFLASSTVQPKGHLRRPNGVPVADFGRTPEAFDEKGFLEYMKGNPIPDTWGCCWPPNIVHRDLWDLTGGYSLEFSPGIGSDPDFSAKLWYAGVRYFKTLGDSVCYHFMSASVGRVKRNDGHRQFLRKWGVTPRTFNSCWLHTDEKAESAGMPRPNPTRRDLLRCKLKNFFSRPGHPELPVR